MYLKKTQTGYFYLVEKVNGKERYIKSLGTKNPEKVKEMLETGKGAAVILKNNPLLVEVLGNGVKRLYSAERNLKLKTTSLPLIPVGDVYYADPPWKYDFSETITREIENQYPTMELEDIKNLIIPAPEDAALFLWATAPKLTEAMEVIKSWGFIYKTNMVWDKGKIGMGYWFRGQHELLLVATKGNMSPPDSSGRISSVYKQIRAEHSEKPPDIHNMIESMIPDKRYVELFARKPFSEKWVIWGLEAHNA